MTQTMQLPGHSPQEGTKIWEIVFSSGAFIAFLKFLQWLLGKIFDRKHKSDVLEGIEGLRAVYQVLEKALTHCDRALLLSAHNGGGVPNPATPFWVSAIHWPSVIRAGGKRSTPTTASGAIRTPSPCC